MADKGKGGEGKKPHKNKPTSAKYKLYKVSGDKVVKPKHCPRCGPGVFLGGGLNRLHCGKCNYTEFNTK
jgi:ubiquitin-small subunit ribosomal protein S27Ae